MKYLDHQLSKQLTELGCTSESGMWYCSWIKFSSGQTMWRAKGWYLLADNDPAFSGMVDSDRYPAFQLTEIISNRSNAEKVFGEARRLCIHCHSDIKDLRCSGCGHIDPPILNKGGWKTQTKVILDLLLQDKYEEAVSIISQDLAPQGE